MNSQIENDPDYLMALMLQKQFEYEANINSSTNSLVYSPPDKKQHNKQVKKGSLTDASWELVDPTPNIHILFVQFNERFFWNKLLAVTVDWSKRMTSCAGICAYQGRGGLCKITLSEPLLKLRPRKDLVETLLHEMIHAYLFVTHNNRDRDGHGPEFHKHMYRINDEAGTKITVYHSFHDEVKLYQQHWWRCNGPCQNRHPYFGTVRRATNRAPGPNDRWWPDHQSMCGGQFVKVREPENFKSKSTKTSGNKPPSAAPNANNGDIRRYIPVLKEQDCNSRASAAAAVPSSGNVVGFKDLKNGAKVKGAIRNASSTIVINKTNTKTQSKTNVSDAKPAKALNDASRPPIAAFSGVGNSLGNAARAAKSATDKTDYEAVRKRWLDKYENSGAAKPSVRVFATSSAPKQPKLDDVPSDLFLNCPVCDKRISAKELNEHLDACLAHQSSAAESTAQKCFICDRSVPEAQLALHVERCLAANAESDGSAPPSTAECVSCGRRVAPANASDHLRKCLEEAFAGGESSSNSSDSSAATAAAAFKIPCLVCKKAIVAAKLAEHLDEDCTSFVDSDTSVVDLVDGDDDAENASSAAADSVEEVCEAPKYNCPFCLEPFYEREMNAHLDTCLLI